jgi:glycosyltransferase involved in cell wall biosynthesis
MIVFCEPLRCNLEHVPVNSSFLEALELAFPSEKLQVIGDRRHITHLTKGKNEEGHINPGFVPIKLPPRYAPVMKRAIFDYRLTKSILKRFHADDHNLLIFTSVTTTILWSLWLLRNRLSNIDIWTIYHTGLQSLVGWRTRNPIKRMSDFESAIRYSKINDVRFIVLEEPILTTIHRKMPEIDGRVHLIEHPIPPGCASENRNILRAPVQVGFLGLGTKQKGLLTFLEVASKVKKEYPDRSDFHFIGRLHDDLKSGDLAGLEHLKTRPSESRLQRDQYEKLVRQLHYVCLFFEKRHYDVTASGVLLDCIGHEKPIVTSNIALFQKLNERYGDIGHICPDGRYDWLIANLIENPDPERYRRQVENIRRVKQARSPAQVALKIKALRMQTGYAARLAPL